MRRAFVVLAGLAALAATSGDSRAVTQARSSQAAAAPELVYSAGGDIWRSAVVRRTPASAAAGHIVFTRHLGGTGVGDIYSVSADGAGLRRLTTSRNNFDAVYSPDGKRIAFASDRVRAGAPELYVMDATGRDVRRLTRSVNTSSAFFINSQPAWAPDGESIAFVRTHVRIAGSTETTDLWRVSASGGGPTRITRHAGREASPAFTSTGILTFERDGKIYRLVRGRALLELAGTEPAWAPKGGQLAFVRANGVYVTLGGKPAKVADGGAPAWSGDGQRLVFSTKDGLYSAMVNGADLRRLTNPGYPRADLSPSWRGTEARTLQRTAATELGYVRGSGIYTARTDGTGVRRLTTGSSIAWSSDGKRVAFARRDVLYVADADGRNERRLVRGFGPAWSPDGRWLASTTYVQGRFAIQVVRPDGSGRRILTRGVSPDWSPDGKLVAFSTDHLHLENPEIYVVRPDGTGLKRLTRTKGGVHVLGDDGMPDWSPDGKRIVFTSNRTGSGEIWIMNANGIGQRRLAGTSDRDDWAPRFSPDGAWIAFESRGLQTSDVYLVRTDGTGVRRFALRASQPAWRP